MLVDPAPEWRTSQQVADLLGVTRQHVALLARRHGIGARIGRDVLFRPDDVDRLAAMRQPTRGRPKANQE